MRAAVIFSGCGHKEGTEINEAVLCLLALEKRGIDWVGFAPEGTFTARSYIKGRTEKGEERDIIDEAARIARGNVEPLNALNPESFHYLCLPGGLGAAKILSNYKSKGFEGEVIEELASKIQAFHMQNKPIVAICISPAVVAIALKNQTGITITLGEDTTYNKSCNWVTFKSCTADECVVDKKNRIISTPAYMIEEANRFQIAIGIDKAIEEASQFL